MRNSAGDTRCNNFVSIARCLPGGMGHEAGYIRLLEEARGPSFLSGAGLLSLLKDYKGKPGIAFHKAEKDPYRVGVQAVVCFEEILV
jgi:hypothetical protein